MKKKVAIYARISPAILTSRKKHEINHADSNNEGNGKESLDSQINDIKRLCQARGVIVVKVFREVGARGDDTRDEYQEMIDFARKGKCDIVAVWKIDRLGGKSSQIFRLADNFKQWGVDIISYADGIDTTTEMGEIFFKLCGLFSEIEYKNTVKRIRWGVERAMKEGTKSGKPFGRPVLDYDVIRQALIYIEDPDMTGAATKRKCGISDGSYYSIKRIRDRFKKRLPITDEWLKNKKISKRLFKRVNVVYNRLHNITRVGSE